MYLNHEKIRSLLDPIMENATKDVRQANDTEQGTRTAKCGSLSTNPQTSTEQ